MGHPSRRMAQPLMDEPKPFTRTPLTHPDAQPFRWEGRAPACLLIHGLTSTPWEVRPLGLALHEAGFHAESFWLPGHGSTPAALAKVRWTDWTRAVEARFDAMQQAHGAVAVMGTSLGGTLALWLGTSRAPAAVVSLGGAAWLRGAARWAGVLSLLRPFQQKRPHGSAIFDDEARALHPSYPVTSLRAIAEMRTLTNRLRPRLAQLTAPLLVMHARQDSVIEPANASWIFEKAGSRVKELLWLEESDHIITEDHDREVVARAAVAWIERVEGAGGEAML